MTERRDPRIMALIVELGESSHSAPSFSELEELVEPTGPKSLPRSPRRALVMRRPQWLAGLAAAMVVLLVIGGVAWLSQARTEDAPFVTQPPTPSVTAPPTPNSSGGWMRIEDEDAFPQRAEAHSPIINSVVVGGPGLVAVGSDSTSSRGGQTQGTAPTTVPLGSPGKTAAVWVSTDGIDWARIPHDEAVFGGPEDQFMNDVVTGGPGLVAVGGAFRGALVWASTDGIAWSRVYEESGPSINAVTVGGPGLVAVGREAVWTSIDGLAWSRVPDESNLFAGATVNDVAVGPTGALVAVGSGPGECFDPVAIRTGGGENCDSVVWTSADGFGWIRAYSDSEQGGIRGVTKGGPGLIAVGFGGAVWTSPGGVNWTRQPTDEQTFAGASHRLEVITSGGAGVVVVAQRGFGPNALWTSVDGTTWTRIADGGFFDSLSTDARMMDVIATDQGLVAVGSLERDVSTGPNADLRGSAAVWVQIEGG